MIEYDYRLEQDEGDEVKVYQPAFPTTLQSLAILEGPNGSGKSTLLHLLALACHGLWIGEVNKSLRDKIAGLVNGRLQKLSFDIAMSDRAGSPVLSACKASNSTSIELRDAAGKLVTSEEFAKKYRLIYDIPEDPLNRLDHLLRDIRLGQLNLAKGVGGLRIACFQVQRDIADGRNPDKIGRLEAEIAEVQKKRRIADRNLQGQQETLKEVQRLAAVKFYASYSDVEKRAQADIAAHKKEDRAKKKDWKARSNESAALEGDIRDKTDTLDTLYQEVTPLLRSMFARGPEKDQFALWSDINIRAEIYPNPELNQTTRRVGLHFQRVLQDEHKKLAADANLEEARLLRDMLELLSRYQDSVVEIPGANLSVKKFADVLAAALADQQGVVTKDNKVSEAIVQLEQMLTLRERLVELIRKLRDFGDDDDAEIEPVQEWDDLELLQRRLDKVTKKLEFYRSELGKLDINPSQAEDLYEGLVLSKAMDGSELDLLSEEELLDRIAGLEASVSTLDGQVRAHTGNITYLTNDLEKLKKCEPHQYQERADRLEALLAVVQRIDARLNQYDDFIVELSKRKGEPSTDDPERSDYYEHVFAYLGRRVGEVRHASETYRVAKIDLLKREIVSTEGKQLQVDWLSTGEGQSAYLAGLLAGTDGRTVIALFDEVAMMDSKSLAPITRRLIELYNSDQLLVGLVAQKRDDKVVLKALV